MAPFLMVFMVLLTSKTLAAPDLRIPLAAEKVSLNPFAIQDQSSLWVSRQINCQLVRFEKSQLKLDAAGDVKWLNDKTLRISIAKNARFHNQQPVRVEDVLASFANLRESRSVLRNIFEWIDTFTKASDDTIEIKLKTKVPAFLRVLSSPHYAIFSKDFIDKAKKNPSQWDQPMGCGKYKVTESNPGFIRLEPLLINAKPIKFTLGVKQSISKRIVDQFDIIGLPIDKDIEAEKNGFQEIKLFDPYQIFLGLNVNKSPWKEKINRCDFFSKLDRSPVVSSYKDLAELATDILPKGVTGFTPGIDYVKSLQNGFSKNFAPALSRPFTLTFLGVSIGESYRPQYEKMIASVYSNLQTDVIENPKYFAEEFAKKNNDAMILGLKSNYLDAYEYICLFKEKAANLTGYWNNKLVAEIDASQMAETPKDRATIYRKITQQIRDQCLIYPIITVPSKLVFVRKNLKVPGIGTTPLNEYFLGEVQ